MKMVGNIREAKEKTKKKSSGKVKDASAASYHNIEKKNLFIFLVYFNALLDTTSLYIFVLKSLYLSLFFSY